MMLQSPGTRTCFLAGILFVAAGLSYLAGRVCLAAYWEASWNADRMLHAARLEPTNADYWYRLGLYQKWDFERRDPLRAVAYFQRAAEANPRSDLNWMELADAYEVLGQTIRSQEAFERAQSVHPSSAEVAWRYGNFLLRHGKYPQAFAEIRRALLTDPSLTGDAVSECSKVSDDFAHTLGQVLPNQNEYYLTALNYFLAKHETDDALIAWDGLLALKHSAEIAQAVPLVNELILKQRIEDAKRVWQQALVANGGMKDDKNDKTVVFNGGFEREPLNGAFDWRENPVPGVAFAPDSSVVHSGEHALRITFDGSANLDFQNLWQLSPVEPNRRYHFAAYVRLDGITTDSGVRFTIYDTFHPLAPRILTSNLVGSEQWLLVETTLVTNPDTQLLTIALRRIPSWKFDNKIAGTVWIDDVSLVPVSTASIEGP